MNPKANCFFEFDWISWFNNQCLNYYVMIKKYMLILFIQQMIKNCAIVKLKIFNSTKTPIVWLFVSRFKVHLIFKWIMISRHCQFLNRNIDPAQWSLNICVENGKSTSEFKTTISNDVQLNVALRSSDVC